LPHTLGQKIERIRMKMKRTGLCKATPETIWNTCFHNVEGWPAWDPDMRAVTDASGPCETGTTMTFHMNDGGKFAMRCENVVQNRRLEFKGGFLLGLAGALGTIELEPTPSSTSDSPETRVTYSFGLTGMAGNVFGWINRKPIERGTEDGLANILAMSESAQK